MKLRQVRLRAGARLFGTVAALLAAKPLAAQEATSELPPGSGLIPEQISTFGGEVDFLFYLILGITTVICVVVLGLLVYCLVKYRQRDGRERAFFTHGSKRLEVVWTFATAAMLLFLALIQKGAWSEIKQELPDESKAFLVRAYAERFAWHFVYPGPDGTFEVDEPLEYWADDNVLGLKDKSKDKVSANLVVPVDTPVIVEINSLAKYTFDYDKDEVVQTEHGVLHAFFSPQMRLKQDIVPGMSQKIWFQVLPEKEGTYEIVCAELCGQGHYKMNAKMIVTDRDGLKNHPDFGYDWKAPGAFPATFGANDDKQGD